MWRYTILLSIEEKAPTFLIIENYVDMEELLWQYDHHNYVGLSVQSSWTYHVQMSQKKPESKTKKDVAKLLNYE